MYAGVRGTRIFFDIDGASVILDRGHVRERPTAFLVHGGPGADHLGLKERYGPLVDRMQLVYFDHRGHGRSARGDPAQYTLDENVEDMEALRRYLGLGPIISIGTSYGGMVAQAHAARYPQSVSHLILVVTASHRGYADRAQQIVAERGTREQIAMVNDFFSGRIDTPEKMQAFMRVMGPLYSRRYDRASFRGFGPSILEPEPQNRAHGPGGVLRNFDLRPELRTITARTLILAARHDWICAPELSLEIHRLISGSDIRIFEESSHLIGADEPQALLDAIRGFAVYTGKDYSECVGPPGH